ncbi:MAG: hemerythrin domain-containing protein [Chloroflexi bacterium]|nr:hemerythrin domain-containing protein [Chloroflexota bacterium]
MQAVEQVFRVTDRGDLTITEILRVEHRTLRELMAATERWLLAQVAPDALRERAALLEVALDTHAAREEDQLFAPLRSRSETARHLTESMEIVHEEVRTLFEQIAASADPTSDLWTVLQITEEHFQVEERDLFRLAEQLMEHDELIRSKAQNENR